jgi:hypothetical protein
VARFIGASPSSTTASNDPTVTRRDTSAYISHEFSWPAEVIAPGHILRPAAAIRIGAAFSLGRTARYSGRMTCRPFDVACPGGSGAPILEDDSIHQVKNRLVDRSLRTRNLVPAARRMQRAASMEERYGLPRRERWD